MVIVDPQEFYFVPEMPLKIPNNTLTSKLSNAIYEL